MDYLERGLPFHAHEVFEMRWRAAPPNDREAWRALAQWGAALTHRARGNAIGASALARRTIQTLGRAPRVPDCIDVTRVEHSCREILTNASPLMSVDDLTAGEAADGSRPGLVADPAGARVDGGIG